MGDAQPSLTSCGNQRVTGCGCPSEEAEGRVETLSWAPGFLLSLPYLPSTGRHDLCAP